MKENARKTSKEYQDNLNNSIRSGEGTLAGCLGEEMFQKVFPFMVRTNTFEYDFTYENLTFDVKTKERTVEPKLFYDCSVNTMNGKQNVDHYVFAQVLDSYDYGWLLGTMKSSKFFDRATLHPEGSRDENNGFTFHCDTYNIPIKELRAITPPEGWQS